VEHLAKLAEAEKEGKAKGKGKKKVEDASQPPVSSAVDQNSEIEVGSRFGMKRKAVLPKLTKEMVTQGTQVIVIVDDDKVTSEELILNVSIVNVMEEMESDASDTMYS